MNITELVPGTMPYRWFMEEMEKARERGCRIRIIADGDYLKVGVGGDMWTADLFYFEKQKANR